ncbi:MAG: family 16 glycosylhydrolase, partial [Methylococcales bacterium]|nr:family 16 glycosylhydrolase [Methylococcales bacterium]
HTTLHTNQTGKLTSHPYDHTTSDDLTKDFHLYSVVWTKERVYWYLDGDPVASHPTPDDYKRPVHFLLNLAVGGSWPGAPDDKTEFPARYRIDKVVAWEENGSCS